MSSAMTPNAMLRTIELYTNNTLQQRKLERTERLNASPLALAPPSSPPPCPCRLPLLHQAALRHLPLPPTPPPPAPRRRDGCLAPHTPSASARPTKHLFFISDPENKYIPTLFLSHFPVSFPYALARTAISCVVHTIRSEPRRCRVFQFANVWSHSHDGIKNRGESHPPPATEMGAWHPTHRAQALAKQDAGQRKYPVVDTTSS